MSLGLRTVTGEFNNLVQGNTQFGAADTLFPRLVDPEFREADDNPRIPGVNLTSYAQTSGSVYDSQPRTISNLIVDQTAEQPGRLRRGLRRRRGRGPPHRGRRAQGWRRGHRALAGRHFGTADD